MKKFATCLNCMDGRVQFPVIHWIQDKYNIEFVDMITEAGMDGILAEYKTSISDNLLKKIDISLNLHNSDLIFIVGHYDCGGNSVDNHKHKEQILLSVERLKKMNLKENISIVGLWVDENWKVWELT